MLGCRTDLPIETSKTIAMRGVASFIISPEDYMCPGGTTQVDEDIALTAMSSIVHLPSNEHLVGNCQVLHICPQPKHPRCARGI